MRYCDIVMKGGITSGVVYPRAAVRLAERYRFRNIGGTSAGAIAAAAVAAAERGRRSGANPAAYERLEALPAWLGENLVSLFQPSRRMRPLFDLLLAVSGAGRLGKIAAPLNAFPLAALVGLLPGAALVWIAATAGADALARDASSPRSPSRRRGGCADCPTPTSASAPATTATAR
jgi:peptidoglycan/LPS O-acetylase OafA/YrhL